MTGLALAGVLLALGDALVDGVGVAAGTQKLGAGVGASSVRFVGELALPPPSSRSAAGTTIDLITESASAITAPTSL